MERKLGEIQQINGKWYQLVKADKNNSCNGCSFFLSDNGKDCIIRCRNYGLIYKKLKIGGVPYSRDGKTYQTYIVPYTSYFYNGEYYVCQAFDSRYFIAEINKEDMEDNKKQTSLNSTKGIYEKFKGKTVQCLVNNKDGDLVNGYGIVCGYRDKYLIIGFTNEYEGCIKSFTDNVFLENRDFLSYRFWNISHVDDKPFIKPFNLEAARSGKPVCTRDGRKVRIICFDRINGDYYKIVACVTAFDGDFEEVLFYGIDGYIVDSQNPKDEDLMMLLEKKEGWINICRNLNTNKTELDTKDIYNTKEEALQNLSSMTYVTTVKIEWEE